jgi:hypothetical protein
VPITLTGTDFTSDYYPSGQLDITVAASTGSDPAAAGVTVENVVVVNDTTMTCDLVISQIAEIGYRNIRITHTGGYSTNKHFWVGYPSDFLVFFG